MTTNTLLTPTMITREALRVLHQKLMFVGKINRQYDDRFAQSGAKIGTALQIRKPPKYTVRTGVNLSAQDSTESYTTLTVSSQKGVDMSFTSVERTMNIDDFSKRFLEPAMSVLAANIEADVFSVYKDVWSQAGTPGTALTSLKTVLQGRKLMNDTLAPMSPRYFEYGTQANVDLVDALKGLFQSSSQISDQYEDGMMGMTAGFKFFENTLAPTHSVGTYGGTPLTNGASQTGSSLVTDGWTATTTVLKKGTVFTIAGVNAVHAETKADLGYLQQFVVTSDTVTDGSGNSTIAISPAIVATGAFQNVTNAAGDNKAITVSGTSGLTYSEGLAFHPDAFTFATADLVLPGGVDFAAREVMDGISMRIVRAYDINTDAFPVRIDVLYGKQTLYAELAARISST